MKSSATGTNLVYWSERQVLPAQLPKNGSLSHHFLGTCFSKAIFVPSISTYNKVTSGTSVVPSDISSKDLSWQFSLQRLWEKIAHGIDTDSLLETRTKMDGAETLPRREFLYEDASNCSPADG